MASVEVPLGSAQADAAGTFALNYQIPPGTALGRHRLILRQVSTGEQVYVEQIAVDVANDCLTTERAEDIDGDLVRDGCDPNPTDGPDADADFDLVANAVDNCPLVPNQDQQQIGDRSNGVVCDPRQGFNPTEVIVAPSSYPQPPEATNDTAVVETSAQIEIDVVANDVETDAAIDQQSVTVVDQPTIGSATVTVTGSVIYAAPSVEGTATLTYAVCDQTQRCDVATVTITVNGGQGTGFSCDGLVPTIEGTEASETINGSSGDDIIFAYGGDDKINGKGGNDIVCAGPGNDTINLEDGDDIVDTGGGDDKVNAEGGDNTVFAPAGNNIINGGNGVDTVLAGPGNDTANTKGGDDVVDLGDGDNTANTSSGNDLVITGAGDDVLNLGSGDDSGTAGAGDDRINAGGGTDVADGGQGEDTCFGEETAIACEF